jgi:hypothetical protein
MLCLRHRDSLETERKGASAEGLSYQKADEEVADRED